MGKKVEVIKKLLLIIPIVVHTLEATNQLKNSFSTQDVRFGSIATVSFLAITYIFLTVFSVIFSSTF